MFNSIIFLDIFWQYEVFAQKTQKLKTQNGKFVLNKSIKFLVAYEFFLYSCTRYMQREKGDISNRKKICSKQTFHFEF